MGSDQPVTLCIINRNGAQRLPATLQAAREQDFALAEVVFVDDASDDDSVDVAVRAWPGVRVVRLQKHGGPAAARNAALAAAVHARIVFIDNDVHLRPGTIRTLLAALDSCPGALVAAPRVVYAAAPDVIQYDSADCHFLGMMATRNADRRLADVDARLTKTSSLVTACFAIDRRVWTGGDFFDDSLGFNLEDHDFGVRASLRGHPLLVEPHACVEHGEGTASLSFRPGRAIPSERLFCLVRNRWFVIAKCFSVRSLVVLAPALVLFELSQLAGLISQRSLGVWLRAARSLTEQWPRLLAERRVIQRTRRVQDAEILRGGPLPLTGALRRTALQRSGIAAIDWACAAYWRMVRGLI